MPSVTSTILAIDPRNTRLKDGLRAVWSSATGKTRAARAPSHALPDKPVAAEPPIDDSTLFRTAIAGTRPLAAVNRIELPKKPSRRVSMPRSSAEIREKPAQKSAQDDLPASWRNNDAPRRLPSDPEQRALHLAMAGVNPLPDSNRVVLGKPHPSPAAQQTLADHRAVLHESLHAPIALQDRLEGGDEAVYLRNGLAQTTLRDLRRGRWVIQDEVDLHGLNREQARHLIAGFLHTCLHQGKRCVRIVHGKGHGSPQKLSILRQLVRGWLAQRNEVLAYCQAKPQDGGEGALLVLLRAPRN